MTVLARLAAALLQGALALFPPGYRREYGEERACVLRLALAEAAACGWRPLLRFFAREMRDLPLGLLREHWKAWRLWMDGIWHSTRPPGESLAGLQVLWFLTPFLFVLLIPLHGLVQGRLTIFDVLILSLLVLVLGLSIAGLFKTLPFWALPSLGLVLSIVDLALLRSLVYAAPGLLQLKASLWTNSMPERVLYAAILSTLSIVPVFLLLAGLGLLTRIRMALVAFRERLSRDWALLPFLLYTTRLITPFENDPYRGLEPYQLLFILILLGGTLIYLRASRPLARMAALLAATLLTGAVLALGVYQVYPHQSWVLEGLSSFPHWWETLMPLLNTLVMMVALCLMAVFGNWLRPGRLSEAASHSASNY